MKNYYTCVLTLQAEQMLGIIIVQFNVQSPVKALASGATHPRVLISECQSVAHASA